MIACDLGSNTLSIIEIDCVTKKKINEYEKIVKTADGLATSSKISNLAVNRVIEALNEAKKIINFENDDVRCVATAALRLAENSNEIIEKIYKQTGLRFEIIDAKQEALYTSLGVENRLKLLNYDVDEYLLVDIGGGSTELIFKFGTKKITRSFDKGIVTVSQKYTQCEQLKENLDGEFLDLLNFVNETYRVYNKPKLFVATSGTPTTVAAFYNNLNYDDYDEDIVNGVKINNKILDDSYSKYLKMSFDERGIWFGKGREESMCAGFLILKKVLNICDYSDVIVIDDGLKHGVAINGC